MRRVAGHAALAAASGTLCWCLTLCGVLLLQRVDPAFASLPTGILRDVFPANPQWVLLGTLCVLLGCLGVFLWLPGYLHADAPDHPAPAGKTVLDGRVRRTRIAALSALAGMAAYLPALWQAWHHAAGVPALGCLVVSVACFGVALGSMMQPWHRPARRLQGLSRYDGAAIAAITIAMVIVMSHDLRSWVYAYVGDEWFFYQQAASIVHGASFDAFSQHGVYGFNPVADSLYQAVVMRLFGVDVFGWRMSAVLATALPVPSLYWGAKQMGGSAFAATSSVIYASCPLLWAFAHIGYNNDDPLLLMVLSAALFFVGWRDDRPLFLYAAGALAGAGWYSFFGARPMIVVLLAATLTDWRDGWPALARRWLSGLAGFTLTVLPLFLDNGGDTIAQMVQSGRLVSGAAAHTLLQQNTVRALYEFLYATVDHHYTVGALFDVLSATSLCVGTALAVRSLRARWSRLVLIWFVITLGTTTPLNYAADVSVTRSMVVVPPAALLAALGLCALCAAIASLAGHDARRPLFALGLSGALGVVMALNGLHFFRDATSLPHRWPPYPVMVMTMEAITTTGPGAAFILPADMSTQNANGDLCTVLDGFQVDPWTVLSLSGRGVAPYCPTGAGAGETVSAVVLLLDDAQAAGRCAVTPTSVYRENQGTLWAYRLSVPPGPVGTTIRSLLPRPWHTCPALGHG